MFDIVLYLGMCVIGYVIAIPLRKHKEKLSWIGMAQTVAVLLLVFTMGSRIGANEEIIKNLSTYGVYAFLFTIITMTLSIIAVIFARKLLGIDRYGLMAKANTEKGIDTGLILDNEKGVTVSITEENQKKESTFDPMTLMIIGIVTLGILSGYFVFRNIFGGFNQFNSIAATAISIELCILLIFVGIDTGLSGEIIDNFKMVGLRALAIPLAVVIGTMAGAVVMGLILPLSMKEALGIGAGFGWYSLAPALIMDAGMLSAGAISFMHNVMRELFGIILIPIVAKKIGYVETVALPGAAAMDVCLPIVVRSTSNNIAIYSFISGVVLTIVVPILVPLVIH